MEQAIRDLPKQFQYHPVVQNLEHWKKPSKILVCAMGGSALASGLLHMVHPEIDLLVHRDYGLPILPHGGYDDRLIILASYSGNTEEVIDAYATARRQGLSVAVIAKGGRLIELAEADRVPYVKLPDTGIQPRNALGFTLRAQLQLMGKGDILQNTEAVAKHWDGVTYEHEGRALAIRLRGKLPVVYSSTNNQALAYVWKIAMNENGKVPSMTNVVPELNHNEMQGFYVTNATQNLSKNFYFLFLHDDHDHPRIKRRMEIMKSLYVERGLQVEMVEFVGGDIWHRIFASIAVVNWAGYYLATGYGTDPERVEMVESFKKALG